MQRFVYTEDPALARREHEEADTIPRLVRGAASRFGQRVAIDDAAAGVRIGFAELLERSRDLAASLLSMGLTQGDRVAVWAPNSWQWVLAAVSAQSTGAVLVPINTRWKGTEAADVLRRSRARVLFVVDELLGLDYVAELRAVAGAASGDRPVSGLPHLERVIVLGEPRPGAESFEEFERNAARTTVSLDDAEARALGVLRTDLSDILYTSGTTGHPKGVMCTHGQTLRAFRTWSTVVGLAEGDRYLIVNPYFHSFGYKAGWLACLLTGAVNLPEPVFDAGRVLDRIARDRVQVLPGPPSLYQSLLDHPRRAEADLSSLRLAVTGAASVPVELVHRMRTVLGFRDVLTAYGLTECSGVATMCTADDDLQTIAGTAGRAIPGTEARVVRTGASDGSSDGNQASEAPRGEPGEVWLRGYHVMQGYFEEPEETARTIDADGWLHTGDVGVMDERGNLRITDRLKDMYIVGGFNAYPAEIESAMLQHEHVARVAVVGVPDPRLGEVGKAFVVPRPGVTVSGDDLIAWCRARMANYKVPRYVCFVDALPMNATGKVQKYLLKQAQHEESAP